VTPLADEPATMGDEIPLVTWRGEAIDCARCPHAAERDGGLCEPGRSCVQDRYARRIDRFFRLHPERANEHLDHPYFEVRAIAARHADLFHLMRLVGDVDETVRHSVAMRLPQKQLLAMAGDPHREVRIRVAWRLDPPMLGCLQRDTDYHVRSIVARRLPLALLGTLARDPDEAVRAEVAKRLEMPALWGLLDDDSPTVRRILAERLPAPLLDRLARDADIRVRWAVTQRADRRLLTQMLADTDPEIRREADARLATMPVAVAAHAAAPTRPEGSIHG
jgi:LRV protein FeS4 cluster/Leucine rich repeat variant